MQRHGDQLHAVTVHHGNKRIQRRVRVAGLAADKAARPVGGIQHPVVMVLENPGLRHIGGRYRILLRMHDFPEQTVLQRFPGDERQVMRRGMMLLVGHPAGIGKIRARAAQLRGPLIHHREKCIQRTAADKLADLRRDIICGLKHRSVQHISQRKDFPDLRVQIGAAADRIPDARLRHRDLGIQIAVLDRDERRHDLGQRSRRRLDVHPLLAQNGAGPGIHHTDEITDGIRRFRPAFGRIGGHHRGIGIRGRFRGTFFRRRRQNGKHGDDKHQEH